MEVRKRKKYNKRKSNRRFMNFVIILIVISSMYFTKVFISQWHYNKELNFQIDQLVERKNKLNEEISDLEVAYEDKDSLEFVEKVAREKLGMIKAREYIVKEK